MATTYTRLGPLLVAKLDDGTLIESVYTVDPATGLPSSGGGGGGGDASAANQTTGNTSLAALVAQMGNQLATSGKQSFTRPNDATPYAAGDLIANDTTAGSVTAMAFTGVTIAGGAGKGSIVNVTLRRSGGGSALVRAHFFKTNHAVTNGDNGAFVATSLNDDNYIAPVDFSMIAGGPAGTSFGFAQCALDYSIASGDTIYCLLEAMGIFTPTAVETFTMVIKTRRFS